MALLREKPVTKEDNQMITKGTKIKINGQKVTVDDVCRSKFGRIVYYSLNGEYLWTYEREIIG